MAGPIPDIRSLREICHSGKVSRDQRPWYVLQRRVTIYLTWLVLHTGAEANHVTIVTVLLALAGSVLLAMASPALAFTGALLLLAHHVLDKVDGDVARFRGRHSVIGVYLDDLGHSIAFAGIFLGLGVHLAQGPVGSALAPMLAGALGGLAMLMGRIQKSVGFQIFAQHVLGRPELEPNGRASRWSVLSRGATHRDRGEGKGEPRARFSPAAWFRDLVLQLSDFTVVLVLVVAGTALELIGGSRATLVAVLYGGAAFHLAVLFAVVVINLKVNVESEVRRLNEMVEHDGDSRDT